MADLVIRCGTLSDVSAIMALEQGSIEHPWESKAIESLITDDNKTCLVAEIDGTMTTDYERYAEYPHIGIDSIERDTGRLFGYRTVQEDNVKSGKYIFINNFILVKLL